MKSLKLLKVIAALEGGYITYNGKCPHFQGISGDDDYGTHCESSGVVVMNTDGRNKRCIVPCKQHLQYYLGSGSWKEI
jgi:hypothetical protein